MARFLLSRSVVLGQHNLVSELGLVSYSFKTNPVVGKILEESTGCMFSVHFINELRLISDKSRVWFLTQAINESLLDELFYKGVSKFVVENEEDLGVLLDYIAKHDKKIDLLLRIKLKENTIKTEKYYVFGMDVDVVNARIVQLSKVDNVLSLGIHFHRKTQNVSEWDLIRELSEMIDENNWEHLDYVNIGGGLPVKYKNISDKIIPSVILKIVELKEWLSRKGVNLIIEPGRFICAPALKLETVVVGVHGSTIVVDASVYNASPDTLIVPIKLLVEGEMDELNGQPFVIKGITPCSTDLFRYRVYLPKKPVVGDTLVFINAGAYNFHTEFCELDKIKTDIVD